MWLISLLGFLVERMKLYVRAHKPLFHTSIFFLLQKAYTTLYCADTFAQLYLTFIFTFGVKSLRYAQTNTRRERKRVRENERANMRFFPLDIMKTFINREGQIVNEIEMNSKWQIQNSFIPKQ